MPAVTANGITIEAERHGDHGAPALLMIRGLGTQLIQWPPALIDGFVAAGLQVIVFDNRDAGLSQDFAAGPEYGIDDMADDAVGVLDAFGIGRAHVLGISMGGMILQNIAVRHGDRLRSAIIVMSSSRAAGLPDRDPAIQALLFADPGDPAADREAVVRHILRCDRAWGSPGFPFDEAERRALIERCIDRAWRPDGVTRQAKAVLQSPGFADALAGVATPTLVVNGDSDTLIPVAHGRDIAARIPGARYVEVAGMGHDLEGGIVDILLREATAHIRAAEAATA